MSKKVLIGLPVFQRDWILPTWLRYVERQGFSLSDIGFIFELGPNDEATHNVLLDWHEKHPEVMCFQGDIRNELHHEHHPDGMRLWSMARYVTMATMRNNLLERATAMEDKFDYYFSLDSDILLTRPDTLSRLIHYAESYPNCVVSPLTYMTPDTKLFPSIMSWRDSIGGRAYRDPEYPIGQPFLADIVMAAVLMPRPVYTQVRYRCHRQGEDLGFAGQLSLYNFKSLAASDIELPHIMHRYMLDPYLDKETVA